MTGTTRTRMTKEDRRQHILAIATEMVGEWGFNDLSLKDLAKRCGVTDAGILHHFGSKERLLLELLQERDRHDERAIELDLLTGSIVNNRSIEGVQAILRTIVAINAAKPELVRLFVVLGAESLVKTHPAHQYFQRRHAATLASLANLVHWVVDDPAATARQITAIMNGLELQWLRENLGFDLVAAWEQAARKIFN